MKTPTPAVSVTERATLLAMEFGKHVKDLGNGVLEVLSDLGHTLHIVEVGDTLVIPIKALSAEQQSRVLELTGRIAWRARVGHCLPVYAQAIGDAVHLVTERT